MCHVTVNDTPVPVQPSDHSLHVILIIITTIIKGFLSSLYVIIINYN